MGEHHHRLRAVQHEEGRPHPGSRRTCIRTSRRSARPAWHLQQHGKSFPPNYLHETWRDWLYWDIELEG